MAAPIITPIPTPPIRSDAPADFATKADAFAASLPQFVTETNGSASFVDQRAIDADASAQAAAASEGAAASSVAAAADQVALATEQSGLATTNGQAQVALAANQVALAAEQAALATTNGQAQVALATNQAARSESAADQAEIAAAAAGAAAGLPALTGNARKALVVRPDESGVEFATVGSELKRSARTANLMLTAADKGQLIDITSGTFTQTFAPAAELGDGWFCYLRNSGAGTITVDPNASETIDGVGTGLLTPGLFVLLVCDGVGFSAQRIGSATVQQILTSGTAWTCPMGVRRARLRMVGGGSSGIYTGSSTARCSGVGGGYLEAFLSLAPGQVYSYAIGAGGASTNSASPYVNAGGTSTFLAAGVLYEGRGGSPTAQYTQSPGGDAVNGDVNIRGGCNVIMTGQGDGTVGGSTQLGVGGGINSPASGYGSGGAASNGATGPGAPGVIILEY